MGIIIEWNQAGTKPAHLTYDVPSLLLYTHFWEFHAVRVEFYLDSISDKFSSSPSPILTPPLHVSVSFLRESLHRIPFLLTLLLRKLTDQGVCITEGCEGVSAKLIYHFHDNIDDSSGMGRAETAAVM